MGIGENASYIWKYCGEKVKMLVTSIFSFSHNVFRTAHNKCKFFNHTLSAANALNLDQAKILLFGKGLNNKQTII